MFFIGFLLLVVLGLSAYDYISLSPRIQLACIAVLLGIMLLQYVGIVKLAEVMANGMTLLRAQDFGSRLTEVGIPEADMAVEMYNHMMEALKRERLSHNEQVGFTNQLFEASALGIIVMGFDDMRITSVNRMALRILGVDDEERLIGYRPGDIDNDMMKRITELGEGQSVTYRRGDTMVYRLSRRWYMERGFRRPFVTIEIMTEAVHKAEKDAYDKVIRMIAHEVNNTVGGVNSLMETLQEVVDDGDICELIDSCRERCTGLSRFITAYANVVKIPPLITEKLDLNRQLKLWLPFLESMAPDSVKITAVMSDRPVTVLADRVLLEQVVVNIVKNAIESVVPQGGEVRIATHSEWPGIEVVDNGAGISEMVSQKLFTPFFSTKANGQGLGLMLVSELLRRHGCGFSLRTDASDGLTRFVIRFPK